MDLKELVNVGHLSIATDGEFSKSLQAKMLPSTVAEYCRAIVNAFMCMMWEMQERVEIFPGIESVNPRKKVLDWVVGRENDSRFNEDAAMQEMDEGMSEGEEEEGKEEDTHQIGQYRVLIENSEAYHWLMSQFRCDILLSQQPLGNQCRVRDQVLNSFPISRRISREDRSEKVQATFVLDWDPLEFLQTQYSEPPFSMFEAAITLTGSAEEAQATTCREYVEQTWPYMAETLLRLVGGAIRGGYGYSHQGLFHRIFS